MRAINGTFMRPNFARHLETAVRLTATLIINSYIVPADCMQTAHAHAGGGTGDTVRHPKVRPTWRDHHGHQSNLTAEDVQHCRVQSNEHLAEEHAQSPGCVFAIVAATTASQQRSLY